MSKSCEELDWRVQSLSLVELPLGQLERSANAAFLVSSKRMVSFALKLAETKVRPVAAAKGLRTQVHC